jgi:hypothetical protein
MHGWWGGGGGEYKAENVLILRVNASFCIQNVVKYKLVMTEMVFL